MKKLTKEILDAKNLLWVYDKGCLTNVYQFKGVNDLVEVLKDVGAYNEYDAEDWELMEMQMQINVGSLKDIAKVILTEKFFHDEEAEWAFSLKLPDFYGHFDV